MIIRITAKQLLGQPLNNPSIGSTLSFNVYPQEVSAFRSDPGHCQCPRGCNLVEEKASVSVK